jgi:hypothetical protein
MLLSQLLLLVVLIILTLSPFLAGCCMPLELYATSSSSVFDNDFENQVGLASVQVGLASVQAGLASVQVGLALEQVGLALVQAGLASEQVGLALEQSRLALVSPLVQCFLHVLHQHQGKVLSLVLDMASGNSVIRKVMDQEKEKEERASSITSGTNSSLNNGSKHRPHQIVDDAWLQRFHELESFAQRNGHCRIPSEAGSSNNSSSFHKEYGHCSVPQHHPRKHYKYGNLGGWVNKQRFLCRPTVVLVFKKVVYWNHGRISAKASYNLLH